MNIPPRAGGALRSRLPLFLMLALGTLSLGGCLSDEVIPPYDDSAALTSGATRFGSGRVAPAGLTELEDRDTPPVGPGQVRWPAMTPEQRSGLRQRMSEEELLALLGAPLRREIMVQNVDRPGEDWNAWVWTWRFQDEGFDQYALVRDLEVRLAEVTSRDVVLGRAEVDRAGWYVTGWQFY